MNTNPEPLNPLNLDVESSTLGAESSITDTEVPPHKAEKIKRGTPIPGTNLVFWGYRPYCTNREYWVLRPVYDRWMRRERERERMRWKKFIVNTPERRARNAEAAKRYRERKKNTPTPTTNE